MTSQESSADVWESPESPDAIRDSPESPDESKDEEEILFVEDRRPGNVSPVNFNVKTVKDQLAITDDFISLNSKEEKDNEKLAESNTVESTADSDEDSGEELAFVEDRNPQLSGQETQSPRYRISDNFLKLQTPNAVNKKAKFANNCWNCGENSHSLRECTKPRDHALIARCRREFQESRANMPVYKRYHEEKSQKYGHFVPGQLSDDLRQALGLEPQQLPTHIYMMRRLGYPPGWLKEALVTHSGISMFDGQGKEVLAPGIEGGEIVEDGMLDKYDVRKFVQYPGFNADTPPGTYDDSLYWNCPPMSKMQSLEVMLQRLEGKVIGGYKRKKMAHNATLSPEMDDTLQSNESQEMEYEELPETKELPVDNCGFIPPLPEEKLPPPPPTDLPPEPSESSSVDKASLNELEEQKKQLLAQLNDVSPLCSTPQSRVGKIKSVDLGTPIIKSVSPYQRLPTAEKFSKNICDVINFENLPDSTGKYDKISGIIHKVRTRLSQLNDEI